jgi:hypothetical protein
LRWIKGAFGGNHPPGLRSSSSAHEYMTQIKRGHLLSCFLLALSIG